MAYYNQIKKRAKSLFRDIPSDNPDIIVRVTWPDKEGKVKMTGRVINAEGITNEMYQKNISTLRARPIENCLLRFSMQ